MSKKIEMIVFDWAGTTVDYGCEAPLAVFENVLKSKGINLSKEAIRVPMGMGKRDHILTLMQLPEASSQWSKLYGRNWTDTDIDDMFNSFNSELLKVLPEYCTPIEGVPEMIKELKSKGIKIGSTTGYTREMMDIVEKGAEKMGYKPDFCVTSEMTQMLGRPYPYMIFENMKIAKIDSTENVIKVGDTIADIREGKNAGVITVGVLEGSSLAGILIEDLQKLSDDEKERIYENAREKMLSNGADFVIRKITDLPSLLEKIN